MNIEENSNEESKSSSDVPETLPVNGDNNEGEEKELSQSGHDEADTTASPTFSTELVSPENEANSQDSEDANLDVNPKDSKRVELAFAAKSIGIGLLIGIVLAAVGYLRTSSVQHGFANQLVKSDTCGDLASIPSGFCFNSPVSVESNSSNPLSPFMGSTSSATVAALKTRIGIFGNSNVTLSLSKLSGAAVGSSSPLNKTKAGIISGTISLAYAELTNTLRSSSSTSASIFFAGKDEIGTTNEVSYQGQNIALTVTSKVSLKNNSLYLAPITVSALGHSAPASSIFSSTAPVPVVIPKLPKGMKYSSIETTKKNLIFHVVGSNISLGSVFHS